MDEQESPPPVVDQPEQERFVLEWNGTTARLEYEARDDRLVLLHTEVPEQLGGRGVGGLLVKAGVARAERDGLRLAPWCSYARKWLQDHPEAVSSVEIDWSDPPARG
jgi:predicted GNAT family acetyltransferase